MSERVIVVRIFVKVPDSPALQYNELAGFYEEAYAHEGERGLLYARWRALGARGKADHVVELCRRAALRPQSTLEVGCGDGALLCELRGRGFGGVLHGVEIAEAAVRIASERGEIESVELYDGQHLRRPDGAYELGIVSHVLEHVSDPAGLLAEIGRVCGAVVVEVPLEDNLSARRAGKREHAREVGHLQRLDRDSARAIVGRARMRLVEEIEDPLPLEVHCFFAQGAVQEATARGRWAIRSAMHRLAPGLARRAFTVHYACLCLPLR